MLPKIHIPLLFIYQSLITVSLAQPAETNIVVSPELQLQPLGTNAYIHISFEENKRFGRFSSNGLIYIDDNEAVIMDTPSSKRVTQQLIDWLKQHHPAVKIKAVIVNHFHSDCLGGLELFHALGVHSYAHHLTPSLLGNDTLPVPQHRFTKKLTLTVGKKKVISEYFGEAHSRDNIVTWIPEEKILFGGCMIKSMNAGKGNLTDANVTAWPQTVSKVSKKYPQAQWVIPGHGSAGGTELFDYTIKLFSNP
jgi:metallo-beta-lactamase class B